MGCTSSKLPPNWPSPLHNKCDKRRCKFPNPPQAAEGRYNCVGSYHGRPCKGTYYVSRDRVRRTSHAYSNYYAAVDADTRRRREDRQLLREYRAERDYYQRLLHAVRAGDELYIRKYLDENKMTTLRHDWKRWQAHLTDLRGFILELDDKISEIVMRNRQYEECVTVPW
ncbi:hypothetical protein K474DRAFT_1670750 [Panus rudis PR-1116 ss-1]|nr:hypothetical protein K474DRAFT_1670750 [Panus rudis PR-1116 ss-1]